jgi:hypothetical protein
MQKTVAQNELIQNSATSSKNKKNAKKIAIQK